MEIEAKDELKQIIEKDAAGILETMESAKIDLDALAAAVEDKFSIQKAKFKKISKMYYMASLEDEKGKAQEIFELYEAVLGV